MNTNMETSAVYGDHVERAPNILMRWSHGSRFRVALDMLAPRPGEWIADIGAGAGTFLAMVAARIGPETLMGLEVWPDHFNEAVARLGPSIRLVSRFDDLPKAAFDKVTCLETLEHVVDVPALLHDIAGLLRPGGRLIVSVPIEVGPVSLVKNVVRAAQGGAHENATLAAVANAFFYRASAISRKGDGRSIGSHVGFDHRKLGDAFRSAGFTIDRRGYGPTPFRTHLVNSQVYYDLSKSRCRTV